LPYPWAPSTGSGGIAQFHIDIIAYGHLALLSLGLFIVGLVYQKYRPDPALVAMLMGASFLTAFSAAASLLNYFLLTVWDRASTIFWSLPIACWVSTGIA
jgi:hypothetical protein